MEISDRDIEIIKLYKSGMSFVNVSKYIGLTPTSIGNVLKKHDVKARPCSVVRDKYKYNKNAFSSVNESSAYWIGFIMADGCVCKHKFFTRPTLQIHLSGVDYDHLEKFRNFLCTDKPVGLYEYKYKDKNKYNTCVFQINSKELCDDLNKYGVTQRKSKRAFVIGLNNNKDFWRGMIDGDGSVGFTYAGLPYIYLCGNKEILYQYLSFVSILIPNTEFNIYKNNSIYASRISGNKAVTIINTLYNNCSIALDRKQETADYIISNKNIYSYTDVSGPGHYCSKLNWDQVREIRNLKGKISVYKMARMFGVTDSNIKNILNYKIWKNDPSEMVLYNGTL